MDKAKSTKLLQNYFTGLKNRPLGSLERSPDKDRLRQIANDAVKNGIPIKKIPIGKTAKKG